MGTLRDDSLILPHNDEDNLEEHIKGLIQDSPSILADLIKANAKRFAIVEFYAECPEQPNISLYIALVNRWCELQKALERPLRIYTYLYNPDCEKYIQSLLLSHKDIHVTVLPGYLRKAVKLCTTCPENS